MNGVARTGLAAIGTDGTLREFNPELQWRFDLNLPPAAGNVTRLAVANDTVFFGGTFTGVNNQLRAGLAAVGADGTLRSWNPGSNGDIWGISILDDIVYLGGTFTVLGGASRPHLGAVGTDGVLRDWGPTVSGNVETLATDQDVVYVGGAFGVVDLQPRSSLAAIGVDGVLRGWNPSVAGIVSTLAVSEGTVYIGGQFSTIGSVARSRLAAVGTDGTLRGVDGTLRNWDPDANGVVNVLTLAGSDVFIGGDFTTMGGKARDRLAAVATDGTLRSWSGAFDRPVRSIAVADDVVYVGGDFYLAAPPNPYVRQGIAAFTLSSGAMTAWDPGQVGSVSGIAVADGVAYLSGPFAEMAGQPRRYVAALGVDGTLRNWGVGGAIDQSINVIVTRAGKVHVGGRYAVVDAAP